MCYICKLIIFALFFIKWMMVILLRAVLPSSKNQPSMEQGEHHWDTLRSECSSSEELRLFRLLIRVSAHNCNCPSLNCLDWVIKSYEHQMKPIIFMIEKNRKSVQVDQNTSRGLTVVFSGLLSNVIRYYMWSTWKCNKSPVM